MNSSIFRDLGTLIARVGLGVVFVAHGWQKLNTNGLDATTAGFQGMGIPFPQASAYYATFVELIGGAALILGALLPVVGVLLFLDMLGALIFVHAENGVFVTDGGWELVVALGAGAILLAVVGSGRFAVDGAVGGRRSKARSNA